jgi:hypothetical protein
MEINVIFLDIDGVLNPDNSKNPYVFAPACGQQLRRILDSRPDTHVVFSTTWRTGLPFFVLGWLWHQHDLPLRRDIGRTPDIHVDRRGEEVRQWLADAPTRSKDHQLLRFAVVDDEVEPFLSAIERKNVFACDPTLGLTEKVADQVIRHLQA